MHTIFRHRFALAVAFATLPLSTPVLATDIRVEAHGEDRYTLTAELEGTADPLHGQLIVAPEARELCGRRYPHFGRYRFESTEPSRADGSGKGAATLRYTQDIECRDQPQDASATAPVTTQIPVLPVPPAPDTPPTSADEAQVRARTLAYLHTRETADADAAFAMLSPEMLTYTTTLAAWREGRTTFNALAGPGARAEVVRLTWYDNPQGAPSPGRYVAADYRVDYPSRAFTCGYVMWLRQGDGNYLVVREEEALGTPDIVVNLSPEQTAQLRAQVQCRD